jgi:hypothetical protein
MLLTRQGISRATAEEWLADIFPRRQRRRDMRRKPPTRLPAGGAVRVLIQIGQAFDDLEARHLKNGCCSRKW